MINVKANFTKFKKGVVVNMKRVSEETIMSASKPSDIFTMNPDIIEQEKEEYIKRFKPKSYSKVKDFMLTQKVTLLYQQALAILGDKKDRPLSDLSLSITDSSTGNVHCYECHYMYDIKIGKMYVTESHVIFVISSNNKKYYENYIRKTREFPKLNKKVWEHTQYMFPNVTETFQTSEGDWAIFVEKPCKIYPLRELLSYFEGRLEPEYVASIMTRLYYFVCYMDIIGLNHNGIAIDNLFFAPGRTVEEGETFTVDDMRIVGVFGGWFFTTGTDEKLMGMPKEVYEILPSECKKSKFSSFKVDELSLKRVARELLGDVAGENLINVPKAFEDWVKDSNIHKNAYEEYCEWEKVITKSFGGHRFVEFGVSID